MSNKDYKFFRDPMDLKALIRQYASEPLPPWEEHYLEIHKARYQDTLDLLGPGDGQRLLDIGAFPGHLSLAAHHQGFQVYGLTGKAESTTCLNLIEERFSRHQIPIAMADVESEPFPYGDEFFDLVLASEIIEHLHYNPYRLLREAFRVLKPEGYILLSTPNLSRLDNLLRLRKGRSVHSEIKGRFYESFSSILSARHVREYTAHELTYMLEWQNKEMYRFSESEVHYSSCLEPPYSWPRLAGLIKRLWPGFRSTLLVKATRPKQIKLIHPEDLEVSDSFYPAEKQGANMEGIAQMLTTPFRWSSGTAEIGLPASEAPYQIFYINLVYLVPWSLAPAYWDIRVGKKSVSQICLAPDRMFTQLRIVLPHDLARLGSFPLVISGNTWRPRDHRGIDDYEFSINDDRDLGLVVGWDGFLREDCDNYETLLAIARRESRLMEYYESIEAINWRKYDDRWSHFKNLYLLQADFKPTLSMGKDDWRQLGPGWYFLENWAEGPIRWTSRRAEAYLAVKPGSRQLRVRVFSGESFLGDRVNGSLTLSYSQDRLAFFPLTETTFDLPAGIWTDLVVDLLQMIPSQGLIHLILQVDQSRSPTRLIPGSTDTRELGLAVMGMALG
jgi:2-polyprenyl-3-methyl-5-hydroxy-6-metoxy-1,4-benzoquinol methylase